MLVLTNFEGLIIELSTWDSAAKFITPEISCCSKMVFNES